MQIPAHLAKDIINGAVGVMPTDTIFGIVASVASQRSVERIYDIKGRPGAKRMICLIGDIHQLVILGIKPNSTQLNALNNIWPAAVSVDMKCDDTLPYIHLGLFSVAVRLPEPDWLRALICQTGPIVATSANISGQPHANSLHEIKSHLPGMDFYIDGPTGSTPSQLLRLNENGDIEQLSRG